MEENPQRMVSCVLAAWWFLEFRANSLLGQPTPERMNKTLELIIMKTRPVKDSTMQLVSLFHQWYKICDVFLWMRNLQTYSLLVFKRGVLFLTGLISSFWMHFRLIDEFPAYGPISGFWMNFILVYLFGIRVLSFIIVNSIPTGTRQWLFISL